MKNLRKSYKKMQKIEYMHLGEISKVYYKIYNNILNH